MVKMRFFVLVGALLILVSPSLANAQTTWTGTINTDWSNGGNWTAGVPNATVSATIPVTVNKPDLTNLATNGNTLNLSIASGATVNMGPQSLTVAGNLTTTSAGGNYFTITSGTLQVNGTSSIQGNITASLAGTITLTGAMTVNTANLTISTVGGPITFGSTVTGFAGTENLTVNAGAGLVSFGGAVGGAPGLASLSVTSTNAAANAITIRSVTTTGAQGYTGNVTLGAAAVLSSSGNGNVTFSATLNGGNTLSVGNGTGTVTFTGIVGGGTRLTSVSVTSATGTTAINTTGINTTGLQSYAGAVTLGAAAVLSSNGNGNVTFSGTVNGGNTLSVGNGTGTVTFSGIVGGGTPLTSVSVTSATGTTAINTTGITTTGVQSYAGAVTLGANVVLTDSTVSFGSTVTGGGLYSLTLTSSGGITLALSSITGLVNFTKNGGGLVTISGTLTTTGTQTWTDAVSLGGPTTLISSGNGNITFSGTVNGGNTLVVNTGGATTFGAAVGGTTALASVTTDAAGTTTLTGNVSTTGAQTYNDAVTLAAATMLSSSGAGAIALNSTVNGGQTLVVNTGGATTFGAAVGGTTALASVTTDAVGTTTLTGNVSTTGGQAYNDAVTVVANSTLTGSTLGFSSTLDGGLGINVTLNPTTTATLGGTVTVPGTLTIAAGTVDVQSSNFTIGTLANSSIFRLTGTQLTQSITIMNMSGTVQYYDGAGSGTILLSTFFNLEIVGPTRTFTLGQNITVGPASGGGQLLLTNGFLDVNATSNFAITLYGDWRNTQTSANFLARQGTVFFKKPSGTIYVWGDNTWFIFSCTIPGLTILFEQGKTQSMTNNSLSTFQLRGTAGARITITSMAPPAQWLFTLPPLAVLDMQYVDIRYSFATSVLTVPLTCTDDATCTNWKFTVDVLSSRTEDLDHNGKIDRIRVVTATAIGRPAQNNFSNFSVTVDGYYLRVNNSLVPPRPYELALDSAQDPNAALLAPSEFWILIEEKQYLDTNVTPSWIIDANTSLKDTANNYYPVALTSPPPYKQPSTDTAPPIVGYTLAVTGTSQLFVHFSELVYRGVNPLVPGDFSFNAGGLPALSATAITPVTIVGNGISEAVITLSRTLTGDDLTLPVVMSVANAQDAAAVPNALLIPLGHRISDIGLGLPTNGLMEPVFAHDQTQTGPFPGGIGLIQLGGFDGSKWLRNKQNITLEGSIQTLTTGYPANGTGTALKYDLDVPASVRSGNATDGIWLPSFADNVTLSADAFSGLVPTDVNGNTQARTLAELGSSTYPKLRDFMLPGTESKDHDGAVVDFLFQMTFTSQVLYAARVVNPAASDWYRHVTPWSFELRDLIPQRGGVQILRNVINPDRGEATTLQFIQGTAGNVTVTVFDLSGSIIRVLVRQNQPAGDYGVTWDGTNRSGAKVTRGLYFIRIVGPGMDETRKVLVVR